MLLQKWETTAPLTGLFGGGGGGGGLQMSGGGGADALFRMSMFSKSTDSVQITLSRSIVNRRDVFGSTPLHFASAKGCGDVVGLLVNRKMKGSMFETRVNSTFILPTLFTCRSRQEVMSILPTMIAKRRAM